jgi:L-amino acid N-acyltransferase YncA
VAIAAIYNEGIDDRAATFETDPRTAEDIASWLEEDLPLVVVESDGEVVAWAVAHKYREREAYAGVGEFSVYVARHTRGRGFGRAAVQGLIDECERRGLWKLVSRKGDWVGDRINPVPYTIPMKPASRSAAHSASGRSASTDVTQSSTASGVTS